MSMPYYFSKTVDCSFETAIANVTQRLKEKGFGILTEIDVQATLKKKIDVDFHKYKILGACNPHFAHKALLIENKIGVMLPCNIIVQQKNADSPVEVAAVDPVQSMGSVQNANLAGIAAEVQTLLKLVISEL